MSERINIRPAKGLKVRKPLSLTLLSETGESVPWSPFWQRRLDCGDVEYVTANTVTTSAPRPKKKEQDEQ